MPLTSRPSAGPRAILVFLASAVAGALIGAAAGAALTSSMMAATRQQNPQYTGEGLEYVAITVIFVGTAVGAGMAMIYLARRARRARKHRSNQLS
ncbi:MAG TPA: hypothetical protein VGC13_02845 [Longimicrobium sp.]|uniref:hypothetical protein n=1 Tax=Longimicrobium sp. TaxID=2029185 RepID=UPI002ED7D4F3